MKTENQMDYRGYYYTGSASKGSGGIKPDHELPQLSNGKYVLGGRGEKVWENENISANVKYDFDEDRSLNILLSIRKVSIATKIRGRQFIKTVSPYLVAVLMLVMDR